MNLISQAVVIIIYIIFSSERHIHSHRTHSKYKHQRIINGDEVSIKKYPFALADINFGGPSEIQPCAASIIQKYYAITSAVCATLLINVNTMAHVLRGNTSFIKGSDANNHRIIYIFRHPDYLHWESNMNDVALLQVIEPFTGVNEAPIPLAPPNYQYKVGSMVLIVGWGYTDVALTRPSMVLRTGKVRLIDTTRCKNIYQWYNYLNNGLLYIHVSNKQSICATALNSGDCAGDNGGAVTQNGMLIGIISSRVECASERFPSVYMKVSIFYDWIQTILNRSNPNMNI